MLRLAGRHETRRRAVSAGPVLKLTGLARQFGNRRRLGAGWFSSRVLGGDRIGLTGNGSGKSTRLRVLRGELPAGAGTFQWAAGTRPGWPSRPLEERDPDLNQRLTALPGVGTRQARAVPAQYLFTGDEVFERTGGCSGGDRGRVALAGLLLEPWAALLLDEPTDHLDLDAADGGGRPGAPPPDAPGGLS